MRSYLIVDDNRAFAENLAEILEGRGDEAVVATSGRQALGLIQEKRFDALLTDMKMPRMNGAQLVHSVRKLDPGLAVFVVTAYSGDEDLAGVSRDGVSVFFKPLETSVLLDELDRLYALRHPPKHVS